MDTDTIDRLYLELSQFTKAKTRRELELEDLLVSARCIAATAPELLAACQKAWNTLTEFGSSHDETRIGWTLQELDRVIAKATAKKNK